MSAQAEPVPAPALERCRVCGTTSEATPLFQAPSFDSVEESFKLVRCESCGVARVSPLLEGAALGRYYEPQYYGDTDKKFSGPIEALVRRVQARRARRVRDLALATAGSAAPRILDVGCGRGNLIRALARLGCECTGTELDGFAFPSLPAEETARIRFVHGSVERLPLEPAQFDVINIWHVLEHVVEPGAVIAKLASLLKPGGVLIVGVPNFGSFAARLFGPGWFHLDLPRHLYHFDRESLIARLSAAGLRVERVGTSTPDQDLYGFIQSFMNRWISPGRPNDFYRLLKGQRDPAHPVSDRVRFGFYVLLAAPLLAAACVENLLSCALGRGGSLVIYARK